MLSFFRSITKSFPLMLTSLFVALAVWVLAVTSSDPSQTRTYPTPVPIEVIGQSTNLVIVNEVQNTVSVNLRAPASIWESLNSGKAKVRAFIDLSNVKAGESTVPVQVQVGIRPVEIISFTPAEVSVSLEPLTNVEFTIKVVNRGALPVGYQTESPRLSQTTAIVSGAASKVAQVTEVRAVLDLTQVRSDINETITLQAVDANGLPVRDVTVVPEKVNLLQTVTQRGGYRNVVVMVTTDGQVVSGYRLTGITVDPPTITVYSSDPAVIDALPGFVETKVVTLTGKKENFIQLVDLNLPQNLQVIGNTQVEVSVTIEPVVSSLALSDITIEPFGLAANLKAVFTPKVVNVIITGPVPLLDSIFANDVRVLVDLTGYLPGTYTITPKISLNIPGLQIESISPESIQVTISAIR